MTKCKCIKLDIFTFALLSDYSLSFALEPGLYFKILKVILVCWRLNKQRSALYILLSLHWVLTLPFNISASMTTLTTLRYSQQHHLQSSRKSESKFETKSHLMSNRRSAAGSRAWIRITSLCMVLRTIFWSHTKDILLWNRSTMGRWNKNDNVSEFKAFLSYIYKRPLPLFVRIFFVI